MHPLYSVFLFKFQIYNFCALELFIRHEKSFAIKCDADLFHSVLFLHHPILQCASSISLYGPYYFIVQYISQFLSTFAEIVR